MGKKVADRLRASLHLLARAGLADSTSVTELEGAIGADPDLDLAIVHRLGTIGSAESGEALMRIEQSAGGELRREIKRARYRLEQRGITLPRAAAPRRPAPPAPPPLEGYVSAVDGRGDRMVWLVKPRTSGVAHVFAVVNDPVGMREVALTVLSRKALREIREEIRAKHDIQLVAIDWRRADAIMQQAISWATQRSAAIDGDYYAIRAQLTSDPPGSPAEIAALAAPVVPEAGSDELADSSGLFAEPEFRTWLMAPELADRAVRRLMEIRDSPLVLNEAQVKERFNSVADEVLEEVFGGALRVSWQRRFGAMAEYFAATARPEVAQRSAAVAEAFVRGEPLGEIPFCATYVRSTLAVLLEGAERGEAEERRSSLIVTPEEIRRRSQRG